MKKSTLGNIFDFTAFWKNHPTQYNIILDSGFPWGHLDFLQCFHIIITSIHSIFEKLILWGIQNGLICLFTPITFQDMIVSFFYATWYIRKSRHWRKNSNFGTFEGTKTSVTFELFKIEHTLEFQISGPVRL